MSVICSLCIFGQSSWNLEWFQVVCFWHGLAHFWEPISVAPLTTPTTNDALDSQFLLREVTRNDKISKAIVCFPAMLTPTGSRSKLARAILLRLSFVYLCFFRSTRLSVRCVSQQETIPISTSGRGKNLPTIVESPRVDKSVRAALFNHLQASQLWWALAIDIRVQWN